MNNIAFLLEHYQDQIKALNHFIADTYAFLPQQNRSLIRFGGGTALAIYYYQHRLSFDIDLFVTDMQVLNYLSPKHWIGLKKPTILTVALISIFRTTLEF